MTGFCYKRISFAVYTGTSANSNLENALVVYLLIQGLRQERRVHALLTSLIKECSSDRGRTNS